MKLIKLQSEGLPLTESVFTNNINVGYTLPVKCQVALKNISMDFENPLFTLIDSGTEKNNIFSFSTDNGFIQHDVALDPGEYTLNELISEIQRNMNNELSGTGTDKGFQWSIGKEISNTEARLIFAFSRADSVPLVSGTITALGMTNNSTSYFYKNVVDDNNKFNGSLVANTFVNNGGLEVNVTIDNQTSGSPPNINLSNWIFGIDNEKLSQGFDDKPTIIDLMFACVSNNSAGKYTFKKGGELVTGASPISITAGDTITIYKESGVIKYRITTSGGTIYNFEGDNIDDVEGVRDMGKTNLGYSIHVGNDTGKIAFKNCIMTPTPYSNVTTGVYTITEPQNVQSVYLNTSTTTVGPSTVLLFFEDKNTRELLGFLSQIYRKTLLSGSFIGDTSVSISFLSNDIEVEIVELGNINSYSQTNKQLRGIVAVIPKASLRSATQSFGLQAFELSYDETASWAWLSIENAQPLRIPSLTCRVTSNNQLVGLNGKMSVTLLFKSETESN
jgi:hypothetical protein